MDNQQGPTYSMGNSTQYFIINYNEKESEKEYMLMYKWITLLYTWNTVNQLYFHLKKEEG